MRKKIYIIMLILAIFSIPVDKCLAGAIGSKHDMHTQGKGTSDDVCAYCHVPHNAIGDKIWSGWNKSAMPSGYSDIGNMCYTCHDGTVTGIGANTVFNASLQQHKMSTGKDCDMCHTVHDNTNGKFMKIAKSQNSYCARCHSAPANAGGLGDYTAPANHPSYWASKPAHNTGAACATCHDLHSSADINSCNLCHVAHGAVNYSTDIKRLALLKKDNADSAYCAACHPVNVQSNISGERIKHPANVDGSGAGWGKVACNRCHYVHRPKQKTKEPALLIIRNVNSVACNYCHVTASRSMAPHIGLYGHRLGMLLDDVPIVDAEKAPGGKAINDDDIKGPDYPYNQTNNMVCETCHSVHRKGTADQLARLPYNELCANCHSERSGNCKQCHKIHSSQPGPWLGSASRFRPLSAGSAGVDMPSCRIACFNCHSAASESGAPDTQREFTMSRSHHPLGSEEECLRCHLMGKRHKDGNLDSWPDIELRDPDPLDSHIYTGSKINNFCLSCHDNSPVTLGDPPKTPVDLSSAYEFTGHGRIDINEPCNACHEHHASLDKPHLIKDFINDFRITGNDNSVCYACHNYPDGSFAGESAYRASEHGAQNKLCVDCHNPHGDNKDLCYLCHNDKYSAHYSQKRNKLCVDCHNPHQKGDLKMTREDEEKLCFLCHKELEAEFGSIRDGITGVFSHHKVDDEEFGGGKVECFDCHNPHTVNRFNIVSDPNSGGMGMPPGPFPEDAYRQRTYAYDDFCLKCHDGSRIGAKDVKSELNYESALESGFTQDSKNNLHKAHREKGYGCQNCHDAHSSRGTGGIKIGALLHEEITVNGWSQAEKYEQGKGSCSGSGLGIGCH